MNFSLLIAIGISTVLMFSFITKLISIENFHQTIIQLKLPSYFMWIVLVAEGLIAIFLVVDRLRVIGYVGVTILFASFITVTIISINKKMVVQCNCFGNATKENIGWMTLVKIVPILVISIYSLLHYQPNKILDLYFIDFISCVGFTIGLLSIYILIVSAKNMREELTK